MCGMCVGCVEVWCVGSVEVWCVGCVEIWRCGVICGDVWYVGYVKMCGVDIARYV